MESLFVPVVVFGSVCSLALGLPLLYFGIRSWQRTWSVARTDRTPVANLTEGLVEVAGRVQPAVGTVPSPFTDEECLLVQATRDEYMGSGVEGGSRWRNVEKFFRQEPMFVDDGTGVVLVEPDAKTDVKLPWERIGGPSSPLNPIGKPPEGANTHRRVQRTVEPGDGVFVRGRAVERQDSSGHSRFEIVHPDDGPLVVADSEEHVQFENEIGTALLLLFGGVMTVGGLGGLFFAAVGI